MQRASFRTAYRKGLTGLQSSQYARLYSNRRRGSYVPRPSVDAPRCSTTPLASSFHSSFPGRPPRLSFSTQRPTKMPIPKYEYVSDVWRDGIFANKVVFCTGGAGTICSAQVRALVHLGANAAIVGRNLEKTQNAAADIATCRPGAKVLALGGVDVRKPEDLQAAADKTAKQLGSIDFVIAGAAGNFLAPISQLSPNAMKSVIDIDVLGSYNTVKATLPYLLESAAKHRTDGKTPPENGTGGRIIFVSATLHYTGTPLQAHASVAKAGVDALSAAVCIEQGPLGVTSNVIAPGPIAGTEGMERLAKLDSATTPGKGIPSGRWGAVKEIADATVFLFSDAANYVNGDVIVVDGGAWRMPSTNPGQEFQYPDFLINGQEVTGVKGMKKSKL